MLYMFSSRAVQRFERFERFCMFYGFCGGLPGLCPGQLRPCSAGTSLELGALERSQDLSDLKNNKTMRRFSVDLGDLTDVLTNVDR